MEVVEGEFALPPCSNNGFWVLVKFFLAQVYLLAKLSFSLLRYVGCGYIWITKLLRLIGFAICIIPSITPVVYWYCTSPNIKRNVVYGPRGRNLLDVYLPTPRSTDAKVPVAVLVWGGAWTIGYKGWCGLVAKYLSENGILVFAPDYRNFPQGDVEDMLEDLDTAMHWIFENCAKYGGDINEMSLIGQSAGAHLCAMSALRQVLDESSVSAKWNVSRLKHFVGISGVYNVVDNVDEFDKRGLRRGLFKRLMVGDYAKYSPYHFVYSHVNAKLNLRSRGFPPVTLIHGAKDKTSDPSTSTQFASVLQQCHVPVVTHVLEGKTHTDMFLEDQLMGIGDSVNQYLLSIVNSKAAAALDIIYLKSNPGRVSFLTWILLSAARIVNPF